MYLKSVDLFGFKTFAERTRFSFEPGISGIVGPNGSGKSNLVDAVRWVLGEQSAKQLRGERMDAVVFAGNNRRRPLGMAEVTLTFDNADGALATPFAEVSITRRVYRNGEGEYFLNRTQVRLRDIMDLLLGTGLGPDAAAIISQGQIDAILSAKPEARREVFEEVAGTSRYQARKREAQRRLEQTDQNALRVNDVLAELERQAPAIERQVRRAKRYRKLQQRLRDLEILSFVRNTSDRRAERTRIAADLEAEQASAQGAGARARLEAELSKGRYEEYQATLALDERNSSRNTAAAAVAEAASEQAAAQARLEEAQRRCETAERDIDVATKAVTDAEARVAKLLAELAAARAERDGQLRAAEDAAAEERAMAVEWERAYAALRAIEDRRARATARAAEGDSSTLAAQTERDRVAESLAQLDEASASVRERIASARKRSTHLESEIGSIEKEIERRSGELLEVQRRATQANEELEGARTEVERRRAAVVESAARLAALREVESGGLGLSPGVALIKEADAEGKIDGVVGVLSDLISVEAGHAAALDAALGARAHDIVVRSVANARAALALLTAKRAGRATFLPLEILGSVEQAPPVHDPHGELRSPEVRRAIEVVRAKPEARAAADYLLANVFIVDSLEIALRFGARVAAATFVTTDGEVVRGAAISGGSEAGPLARKAAIDRLAEELTKLETVARGAQTVFDRARESAARAGSELEKLTAAKVDAQLRRKDAEALRAGVLAEIETAERQAAETEAQRAQARSQLDAAAAHADESGALAAATKREVGALEADRASAAQRSDALVSKLSQLRERHRAAAAGAATLVERVAQIDGDVDAARIDVTARHKDREARVEALRRARGERDRCDSENKRLTKRRAEVDSALTQSQADVETLRAKRDQLTAVCRDLEERFAAATSREREQSLELERRKIRLAEIDSAMSVLTQTFAQHPASQQELDDVSARYADFQGDADAEMRAMRQELDRLGDVNLNALEDHAALIERRDFLRAQLKDLEDARKSILAVIAEIDAESVRLFNAMFEKVAAAFSDTFARLFGGGVGKMWLMESEDPLEAGVEIAAQPPGKKMQSLHALSGGERALTAVALIFAILTVRPSPFYVFDEIDAALDEANIGRFGMLLSELAHRAQIIIITHNKATMTLTDRIYGVTMGEPGVSSVLSLALEQVGA